MAEIEEAKETEKKAQKEKVKGSLESKEKTKKSEEKKEKEKKKEIIKEQTEEQAKKEKKSEGAETEGEFQEEKKKGTKEVEKDDEKGKKKGNRGLVHIYSSKNNTIVHITDVTGAETFSRVSGGMVTKADRLKGAPYQGMLVAQRAVEEAKKRGVKELDIRMRAPGGHRQMNMGRGAQPAIKAILQSGLKVNVIEDVTPIIHGYMRKKGGRRGRRL